jgi:hypothetical protein
LLVHHVFLERRHGFFDLLFGQKRLRPAETVLQPLHQHIGVCLHLSFFQGIAQLKANGVARFVFLIFQFLFVLR